MSVGIRIIRFACLIITALLFTTFLQAQTVKGKIIDAETGKPVHGASIYLNGTYQGTSSDKEGNFALTTTEHNIPLIVSHIGYQSQTIASYWGKTLTILLKRKANILREITIGDDNREQEMRIFLREFIGTQNHECIISNPGDISFTYHRKTLLLTASADEPLLIYNKKLRYKLTYFLSSFRFTPREVSFQGNYFFAEDTTGMTLKETRKILRERDYDYYGSRMHFIRALWANSFMDEGFTITNRNDGELDYNSIIRQQGDKKFIHINSRVNIEYQLRNSFLAPIDSARETLIAANGFYDPNITWGGDMGTQRVGELLPFEFKPFAGPNKTENPLDKISPAVFEQSSAAPDSLVKKFALYNVKKQQGVLFAHFDKTIYTNNENVWFTAYLLNTDASKNDVLSVALINDNDRSIILKDKFIMDKGIAFGNMFLPDTILSGNYSFMVYTNSVVNGKPENVFVQPVTVKNTTVASYKATLLLQDTAMIAPAAGRKVLLITEAPGIKLIAAATVNYYVGDKLHPIIAGTVKTDKAGGYLFTIPTKDITLGNNILEAKITYGTEVKIVKLTLPVQKNTPVVKFYPEGGNLSDAVVSAVGWEVKNTQGVPYAVKGILYQDGKPIDTIATNSYGMGNFMLLPHRESQYYVKLLLADHKDSVYNLPPILSNLPVVTIVNAIVNDTLRLVLKNKLPAKLYVLVHNYKQTFFSFPVQVDAGGKRVKIDLSELPKGLAEITILDSLQRPYAERLFFAHYDQHNALSIAPDKNEYKTRQKVNISLKVADADGKPVSGIVSIACVQANRLEVKKTVDIESYLYLNHELGLLPARQNYLGSSVADKAFLENILLIKGWRRYTWSELMQTTPADTVKRYDSLIFKGLITHFDKPLKKSVNYIVMRDSTMSTSLTAPNGSFVLTTANQLVAEGKKLHLFVTGNSPEEYNFNIPDPYDKVNKLLTANYEPPNYNSFLLNEQKNDADDLKGFEHAVQLKEVKIKGVNDNLLYGFQGIGTNACGDYVCRYNILNCPNHRTASDNRPAVEGESYMINGMLSSYHGCRIAQARPNVKVFDGIHYSLEFYPADYAQVNPSQPEYLSTIYWNHLCKIRPGNDATIQFYTSDITGAFKIIVQGVAGKDVVYGEKSFTVSK